MSTQINEALLDQKLEQLEKARAWSPRVISKLENAIRSDDDYKLFRINPLQYAAEKRMAENEAIDLLLYATKFGLFEMDWHLVCAYCSHVVESLRSMEKLHSHFVCDVCAVENNVSLDDYIQVTFTISRPVRTLAFHAPDSLSVEDYHLKYHFAKGVLPFPNGATFEQVIMHLTALLTYLEPQERRTIELELPPGRLHAVDVNNKTEVMLFIDAQHPEQSTIPLHLIDGKFHTGGLPIAPKDMRFGDVMLKIGQYGEVRNGKVKMEIANLTGTRSPVWLLQFPADFRPAPLQFEPCLSGKKLLTTQTFRDLFRSETVQTDEGIGVKDITFIFTDLKSSTAMYDQIGDAKAYYLVRQHFDVLGKMVSEHNGAIVKTIGDAIMATFMTPIDALQAALAMLKELDEFNRSISQNLYLKVGIHRGHSIVVTLNERLDYFGQTVNIAARVQGLADSSEIYITDETFNTMADSPLLASCAVTSEQVALKGVSDKLKVHKLTLR